MSDVAVVLLSVFVVLLLLGVPVVFTLGLAAVAGLIAADTDVIVLAQRVTAGTQIFSLLAIPGFILAGELMETGGLSKRMIRVAKAFVGHLTGGLGMVTVISGTLFAAISGSAPATTAAIGGIMIPEMGRQGYRRDFSAALAAAAGPIGHLIPPSIPFIVPCGGHSRAINLHRLVGTDGRRGTANEGEERFPACCAYGIVRCD
jgi:tripartite ATP-independent transporter DctM subunit